jgi:hypothetical protein
MDLRDYEQSKFAMAGILRSASTIGCADDRDWHDRLRDLTPGWPRIDSTSSFIVVTSYESPLSEEEFRFFRTATSSSRRIFVVLNKQDLVSRMHL